MKMIRVIKAFTGSVETIVPLFPGFYENVFTKYWNHREDIGKMFTDKMNEKISEIFPSFHYTYEKIYSPSQYNYSTDEIYARADFEWDEIMKYLADNKDAFNNYAKDNFTSYDGYMSFIPNNYDEFIEKMGLADESDLSSFIFGVVEFALHNTFGDNIKYDLEEDVYYDIDFGPDEWFEVDGFTYDNEEDARYEFNDACKKEPSSDHVLTYVTEEGSEELEFYKGK